MQFDFVFDNIFRIRHSLIITKSVRKNEDQLFYNTNVEIREYWSQRNFMWTSEKIPLFYIDNNWDSVE